MISLVIIGGDSLKNKRKCSTLENQIIKALIQHYDVPGSVLQLCNFIYFSQTLRNEYRYYVLILQIRKSGFKDLVNLPSSYSSSVVEELVFKTVSDRVQSRSIYPKSNPAWQGRDYLGNPSISPWLSFKANNLKR